MKKSILHIALIIGTLFSFLLISCKKDDVEAPKISFKTDALYLFANDTLPADSVIKIGINASGVGTNGGIRIFNISKSVNDSTLFTVYSKGLLGSNSDSYAYDFTTTVDSISGTKTKYIFSVTNFNDITSSVSLNVITE